MKKIACAMLCLVVALSCMLMPAAAIDVDALAQNAAEILATLPAGSDYGDVILSQLRAAMPAEMDEEYYVMAENIINQIEINEDQANELLAKIDELKTNVTFVSNNLSEYAPDVKNYILSVIDEAADIVGVVATAIPSSKSETGRASLVVTMKDSGKTIGKIENTFVNKTNVPDVSSHTTAAVVTVSMVALMSVAVVFSKKKLSQLL